MPMTDRKMSGKQPISGGFDLEAFVSGAETSEKPALKQPKKPADPPNADKRASAKPVVKEPPLPEKEFLTERVQLKITPTESAKLKGQAGMVPVSAFLRKFLQDKGLI